jgi:hypothetical protein
MPTPTDSTPAPAITPVAATGASPKAAVTVPPVSISPPITTLPPVITIPPIGGLPTPTALSPGNPKVTTTAPTSSISVTVPNTSGQVTLSLVVTDNLGVVSQPSTVTINIQSAPVAVLTAASDTVAAGGPIQLSGAQSTSSGSIASYTFSLVVPT